MPATFAARRRAIIRDADRRLLAEQGRIARAMGLIVAQSARLPDSPTSSAGYSLQRREALKAELWTRVLKPFYIGPGIEALTTSSAGYSSGTQPQSSYARLLTESIAAAVRLQAQWQLALLRRHTPDTPAGRAVYSWLTGPRPIRETIMDSFSEWLDPRGYRLADRILRMAVEVRARVNQFVDYHLSRGTDSVAMTNGLEQLLTTGEQGRRPYGTQGGYPPRRLLTTEIVAAGGAAAINASQVNPIVRGIQWQLTPAHPRPDHCDVNASGGPDGDGVYSFELLPTYPDHPNCTCALVPVAVARPASAIGDLYTAIQAGEAGALQGILNEEWLTGALLSGAFRQAAEAAGVR